MGRNKNIFIGTRTKNYVMWNVSKYSVPYIKNSIPIKNRTLRMDKECIMINRDKINNSIDVKKIMEDHKIQIKDIEYIVEHKMRDIEIDGMYYIRIKGDIINQL